jgi:hypothetical protein
MSSALICEKLFGLGFDEKLDKIVSGWPAGGGVGVSP